MRLYNTLTRQLDEFKPINPDEVKVYTCGPTVYSTQHIGNYTAYIYWDLLVRALIANGYQVRRVMNVTDVGHLTSDADEGEDKMEKGARISGKTVWEVAQFYLDDFMDNFARLNLLAPAAIARATDYIPQDIELVDCLTERGYTYEIPDGVYYDVSKFASYADFAHLNLDQIIAGARIGENTAKHHPADFAVWKFIADGEDHAMRWDYLGRPGYPGWHLECSTIIHTELGETIDVHTGGIDHIMVHHTNEIAQSEAAFDKPLSNYWLHNSHITIDGEKISKSLGNTIDFNDLAERGYTHTDYRLWVMSGHYQSNRNFTYDELAATHQRLLNYRNWAALRHQAIARSAGQAEAIDNAVISVIASISDNLNSAQALSHLDTILDSTSPTDDQLAKLDEVLGLNLLASAPNITDEQRQLLDDRATARANKDWAKSDQLRDDLLLQNLTVRDTADGQIWQYAN
jgi:cysteinyl-tRNA synthetase